LRIASYNVQNLFGEREADCNGGLVKPRTALKALAGTIGHLGADVILLQEVGSIEVLDTVNGSLNDPYPFRAVLPGNSDRGIHLAILSRAPFELTSHRDLTLTDPGGNVLLEYVSEADAQADRALPVRIQRDLMLAELHVADQGVLALFNVHLKSKTNRPWRRLAADDIRAAEVRHVAARISDYLAAHADRPVILGGDFNDLRSSEVLKPIFDLPLSDPMGEVLAVTGSNPSTYWPKRRMRLDFLLLSSAARASLVQDSARIHASQRARRGSDHYPISVDLELG
jgi:endonuclease/exonuclease/phosphatase family metal-dependent hydrolase